MNWLIRCIHRFNAPVLGALLCLLALVCAAPSAASAGRTQIRVGYTDVPGFFSKDGMNIYNGRAYEYLETIADYLHIDNIYTEGTRQENLERLAAGEIDCIPCPLPYEDGQIVSLQLDHRIGYIAIRRQDAAYQVQLTAALESVAHALSLTKDFTLDAAVQDLEDALDALGAVTGDVTPEDVLDSVFSHFCVGK